MKKTIYLAGGCFWGTQKYLKLVNGVLETETGFANGKRDEVSYKEVCSEDTGAAETVKVVYDSDMITLPFLFDLFFRTIDPTSLNKQGGDVGEQYRTGIYYTDEADRDVIQASLDKLQQDYAEPVVIENLPLTMYCAAEDYHQDYLDKKPDGYCHISFDLYDAVEGAIDMNAPRYKK